MKTAILFGCNYEGTKCELQGCIPDIVRLKKLLESREFKCHCYVDNDTNEKKKPTYYNIIRVLEKSVKNLGKDDILFVAYSGHGSSIKDRDNDESDGKDECLVPCDYLTGGMVTDDELRNILSQGVEGSKIFCLFDSCHSGTALDLPFNLEDIAQKKSKKEVYLPNADVWLLSGCIDAGTSSDIEVRNERGGALTFSFLATVQHSKTMTELLRNVRDHIKNNNLSKQLAQLSSTRKEDETIFF